MILHEVLWFKEACALLDNPASGGRRSLVLDHMAAVGDYFRSKRLPTKVRVKAYSEPPGGGGYYLTTLEPGTYFGPAERVVENHGFVTVLVRGFWMNVGKHKAKITRASS